MQLTARLAHVARHATSPREKWSSTSHPALRLGRRPASSSSQSISKRAARPCALAAYHPFPPGCLLPTSLPDGSRCFLAKVVFFHTTAMAHTFFTLHAATPRDTPQVRRVLVLTLQRPEGCLRCGGGPHAPICRVRPHHALCAASAAAHSPTDTSPLHSPKESGCGTPAATLLRYPREQSRHVSTRASPGARPTASTLRGSFARAEASKVPLAEPVVGALRGMRATNS